MKEKISIISILVNALLAGGKIIIGLFSHSAAILAEGVHSVTDVFSSIIVFSGIQASMKPSDKEHPYGHWKYESLAGLFVTIFLFGTGMWIVYESYQKFFNPAPIELTFLTLGIMLFSAIVNGTTSYLKIYYGEKENAVSLIADGFHDRIDVYTSVAVLVGLFISAFWIHADALLALFIGIYIIKESFSLGKEAADSLLDVSAGEEIEKAIKSIAQSEHIEIDNLKTQKKGAVISANLEIVLPKNLKIEEAEKLSDNLRKKLMAEVKNLQYIIIQIRSHEIETSFYQPVFGSGFGWQRKGKFKDKVEGSEGKGPDGDCVCPQCGYRIPHQRGVPCSTIQCPNCKINLERK